MIGIGASPFATANKTYGSPTFNRAGPGGNWFGTDSKEELNIDSGGGGGGRVGRRRSLSQPLPVSYSEGENRKGGTLEELMKMFEEDNLFPD